MKATVILNIDTDYYEEVIDVESWKITDGVLVFYTKTGNIVGYKHYEAFVIEEGDDE